MTAVSADEITKVVESYPRDRRHSLAILQDLQHTFGYIPREGFDILAKYLETKPAALYAMATFYRALSLKPKGRHVIKVCDGTACHIRGSSILLDSLKRALGVRAGETTADGLFSVETVNCLGACAIGPVMLIDETCHPKVKPDEVQKIIETCRKREQPDG
ncbi:MAG: NADH-quinone oxidoreductase subunit NuoE [Treponema sp.]|jgi:NADH-quinone oxidoreductase subunit E|nr:NADH-quinone oxidoreductase subunit NuoE [Treponema sp.]